MATLVMGQVSLNGKVMVKESFALMIIEIEKKCLVYNKKASEFSEAVEC